jgi:hypothetical protein
MDAKADRFRLHRFPPWHHADEAERHQHVNDRHADNGIHDGARDRPAGILDLRAQVAHLVIAEEQIQHVGGPLPEALEEAHVHPEGIRRQVERQRGIELHDACQNHPPRRHDHRDPQPEHDLRDVGDLPVQRENQEDADARRHQLHLKGGHRRPENFEVLHQPDVAAGDFERAGEQQLPDEQER